MRGGSGGAPRAKFQGLSRSLQSLSCESMCALLVSGREWLSLFALSLASIGVVCPACDTPPWCERYRWRRWCDRDPRQPGFSPNHSKEGCSVNRAPSDCPCSMQGGAPFSSTWPTTLRAVFWCQKIVKKSVPLETASLQSLDRNHFQREQVRISPKKHPMASSTSGIFGAARLVKLASSQPSYES